eukprot:jgi/Chlat1/1064/Chrsp110S01566
MAERSALLSDLWRSSLAAAGAASVKKKEEATEAAMVQVTNQQPPRNNTGTDGKPSTQVIFRAPSEEAGTSSRQPPPTHRQGTKRKAEQASRDELEAARMELQALMLSVAKFHTKWRGDMKRAVTRCLKDLTADNNTVISMVPTGRTYRERPQTQMAPLAQPNSILENLQAEKQALTTQLAERDGLVSELQAKKQTISHQLAERNSNVRRLQAEKVELIQRLERRDGLVKQLQVDKQALDTRLAAAREQSLRQKGQYDGLAQRIAQLLNTLPSSSQGATPMAP